MFEVIEKDEFFVSLYKEEDLAVREVEIEIIVKDEVIVVEESRLDDFVV